MGYPPVPAPPGNICRYAVYLSDYRQLSASSIPKYLNVVRLMHLECNLPNPLCDNWHLSSVLRGIKRCKGEPAHKKLPITPAILLQIHALLNFDSPLHIVFWDACLTLVYSGNQMFWPPRAPLTQRNTFVGVTFWCTLGGWKFWPDGQKQCKIEREFCQFPCLTFRAIPFAQQLLSWGPFSVPLAQRVTALPSLLQHQWVSDLCATARLSNFCVNCYTALGIWKVSLQDIVSDEGGLLSPFRQAYQVIY